MEEKFIQGLSEEGFHNIYYRDYGASSSPQTLVCVHGLTRNSCDFHFLATALQDSRRIVAPDVVGRGKSDRFKNPQNYGYAQYLADMNALLQRLETPQVDWLGTSMGGLFGIILASLPRTPLKRLILNDIGPFVPASAIARIKMYASSEVIFDSLDQAHEILKGTYAPFGPMSPHHWDYLLSHSLVKIEEGYTLAYDPQATGAVEGNEADHEKSMVAEDRLGDVTFWEFWDKITCPVLVINGRDSDILPPEVIQEMSTRGPKFEHVYIEETGHAPSLMPEDQIDVVRAWLEKTDPPAS